MIIITGFIYKIANDVNDKIYIGKTLGKLEDRFSEHKEDCKKQHTRNRPLYRAMNKYGDEHFFIELVEEVDIDILSSRECYWINYYDSYHYGYNATKGGDGKLLFDHKRIVALMEQGLTNKEIINEIGCSQDLLRKIAKRNKINLVNEKSSAYKRIKERQKSVYQLDLNDNIIQYFDSASSAAEWIYDKGHTKSKNKTARNHILDVCHEKRKVAYGFKWKFVSEADKEYLDIN